MLVEFVLKGRGIAVTDHLRRTIERKLARFNRRPTPPVLRFEVEVVEEQNPRVEARRHRVRVAAEGPRVSFRANGAGPNVDTALDQVADRLERQMSTYRSKREDLRSGRRRRLQSEPKPEGLAAPQ